MPAEDVEQFITVPIEHMLDGIQEVESYESSSTIGESTIFVESATGTGEEVTKDIENEVLRLKSELPNVKDTFVMQASTNGGYEFFLDLTGAELSTMSSFATKVVKPQLEGLKEVREVLVSGKEEKEIQITLKSEQLATYGLTDEEIIPQIQQMNTNMSIGSLE